MKLQVGLITALASLVAVSVAHLYRLAYERAERRRNDEAELLNVESELRVNLFISSSIEAETRIRGLRFLTQAWVSSGKLALARRCDSFSSLVDLYAQFRLFNLLADRMDLIRRDPDYHEKQDRLAREHSALIAENERITEAIENVYPLRRR